MDKEITVDNIIGRDPRIPCGDKQYADEILAEEEEYQLGLEDKDEE